MPPPSPSGLAAAEGDDLRVVVAGASSAVGADALVYGAALLLLEAREGTALRGVGVRTISVGLAAFVVLWQVLGDGKTFRIGEKQSVAVLPPLHLLARADPELRLDLSLLVLEEHAGAEWAADFLDVLREADDQEVRDFALGVQE